MDNKKLNTDVSAFLYLQLILDFKNERIIVNLNVVVHMNIEKILLVEMVIIKIIEKYIFLRL